MKHKFGKFFNILNPNHRHDEEHEQATDRKRTGIAKSHRFESYAPIRENNNLKWYVDALDYLWAVSIALDQAQEVIYLADWWISPELFLRRPPFDNQEWRLDQILKRRAEAGVKIYIIVYKEVSRNWLQCANCGLLMASHLGQPSAYLQFSAYQACLGKSLSRRKPRSWKHQGLAPSGPQHFRECGRHDSLLGME